MMPEDDFQQLFVFEQGIKHISWCCVIVAMQRIPIQYGEQKHNLQSA